MFKKITLLRLFGLALALACMPLPAFGAGGEEVERVEVPVSFTKNCGQYSEPIQFTARSGGALLEFSPGVLTAHLIKTKAIVDGELPQAESLTVCATLVGAREKFEFVGEERQAHQTHFYFGSDPKNWRSGVPSFGRIRGRDVYEGIDLVYYSKLGLKYDFIVKSEGNVDDIRVRYEGVEDLSLTADGGLSIATPLGPILEGAPYAYQEIDGVRLEVCASYRLLSEHSFGFVLGELHDEALPVVIDPVLLYSTYLGGSSFDQLGDVAADCNGSAYVVGATLSPDFPAAGGPIPSTQYSAFVTKFLPDGSNIQYSVFLGGSLSQLGHGIAVDGTGRAYICGDTNSSDFPTTAGAFDTTFNGQNDIFVAQLSPAGLLEYSTYLGSSSADLCQRISLNKLAFAAGAIEVDIIGTAFGPSYPTTVGAYDTTFNGVLDMVVTRLGLNSAGAADLIYSTYLGGSAIEDGAGIDTDIAGDIYITGSTRSTDFPGTGAPPPNGTFDVVAAKIHPAGAGAADLVFARIFGGSGEDNGFRVAANLGVGMFVTGATRSPNFPVTLGALQSVYGGGFQDGYVAQLNPSTGALVYNTFLGSTGSERCLDIALHSSGRPTVTGWTDSPGFPTTPGAFDTSHNGLIDIFISELDTGSSALVESTFVGGSQNDFGYGICIDPLDSWYFVGTSESLNYPVTASAFDTSFVGLPMDVVVARFLGAGCSGVGCACSDLKLSLCLGDGGNQVGCTNCPCANNAPIGTVGGCLNSVGTSARLIGTGDVSVSLVPGLTSDLEFSLTAAPSSTFSVLIAGDALAPQNMSNPCFGLGSGVQSAFFDGLRCSVMNIRRHGGRATDLNGDIGLTNNPWGGSGGPLVGIAIAGSYVVGQTRFFQAYYRDNAALSCGTGLNSSQAVAVTFSN